MKALGLLSVLLALVIGAVLVKKQLAATHQLAPSASATAASAAGVEMPQLNSAEDARRLQEQVKDDVNRMMQDRASQVDRGVVEGGDKP